jgi:hypothetical protein
MSNPDPDLIAGNTYLAAIAGAILGLKAIPGTSVKERWGNLLMGALLAIYIGPAMVDYLHITSVRVAAGITFALGAAGLVAFAAIIDGIRQTQFGAIISSWLSRNKGA